MMTAAAGDEDASCGSGHSLSRIRHVDLCLFLLNQLTVMFHHVPPSTAPLSTHFRSKPLLFFTSLSGPNTFLPSCIVYIVESDSVLNPMLPIHSYSKTSILSNRIAFVTFSKVISLNIHVNPVFLIQLNTINFIGFNLIASWFGVTLGHLGLSIRSRTNRE